MGWFENLHKLAIGRQVWRVEDEFSYYGINDEVIAAHAANQVALQQGGPLSGMQTLKSMGLSQEGSLAGKKVLDVGAGECVVSEALAACGVERVVAVDAVPKQMWAAALRARTGDQFEFLIGDVTNLPYQDGSFDLIVGNLILHHIEPLQPLLREIRRLLAPGGRFYAMEPAPLAGMFIHHQASKNEAPIWPKRVAREMREAGFEQVHTQYWWTRLQTQWLGPLSPGYRVMACAPGPPLPGSLERTRACTPTTLPGLEVDSECLFTELALAQLEEIQRRWQRLSKPRGWEQIFQPWKG